MVVAWEGKGMGRRDKKSPYQEGCTGKSPSVFCGTCLPPSTTGKSESRMGEVREDSRDGSTRRHK